MTEETEIPPASSGGAQRGPGDAWQEVGRQFQALGEGLAAAFRAAWDHPDTQRRMQEMKTGVESMMQEVGQALKETTESPEVQRVRAEAEKAAESVRASGEQVVQEVQPHLVAALQQVNEELQRLIERMQPRPPSTPA
jgi:predicted component of type VI protein secretion system